MTHMSALNQGVKGGVMRVLMNHIYEYKKGVRRLVLYTFNQRYINCAVERLEHQGIEYIITPLGNDCVNLFFGRKECLDVIRLVVNRPLNQLSPEEDFMLGALLGYDISLQCERYLRNSARSLNGQRFSEQKYCHCS